MGTIGKYTFLSWVRQGMSNNIKEKDQQGVMSTELVKERARVDFKLNILHGDTTQGQLTKENTSAVNIGKEVQLISPGDILGFSQDALIKVQPQNGVNNFESNYLAYAEFYEEDFPWRYTPAAADLKKLRPWIAILVVKESECTFDSKALPVPRLQINKDAVEKVFYDEKSMYAWAHVHVNKDLGYDGQYAGDHLLNSEIGKNPDVAFSRLICPRKLDKPKENEAFVAYRAFIVPAFECGRLAGLGTSTEGIPAQQPSWQLEELKNIVDLSRLEFPVYYHWSFETGPLGDFETLASLLRPEVPDERFGKQDMNIQRPGMGLDNVADQHILGLEGALRPPGFQCDPWPTSAGDKQFIDKMIALQNLSVDQQEGKKRYVEHPVFKNPLSDDPIVTPPIYGKWHAMVDRIRKHHSGKEWLAEVNLDPRMRAVAAIGAKVVKKNQEQWMEEAWEQVGDVMEANQMIREAEAAMRINEAIFNKHIASADEDYVMSLSDTVHPYLKSNDSGDGETIQQSIEQSRVPQEAKSAAFRRITRPTKKNSKLFKSGENRAALQHGMISKFNDANNDLLTAARKKKAGASAISLSKMSETISYAVDFHDSGRQDQPQSDYYDQLHEVQTEYKEAFTAMQEDLKGMKLPDPKPMVSDADKMLDKVKERLQPNMAMRRELSYKLNLSDDAREMNSEQYRVMAYPEFEEPVYTYLKAISQDFIIPNFSALKENSMTILESNQAFIESFMLGMNHEMASELLWREYPTDQKGSYFRNFWDDKDSEKTVQFEQSDIQEITDWDNHLGEHNQRLFTIHGASQEKKDFIVLVIRGDLLRKYPNTAVYAHRARFATRGPNPQRVLNWEEPVAERYKYPIFQGKLEPNIYMIAFDLTASEAKGNDTDQPGWFFAFKERPGQMQFGLDIWSDRESFNPGDIPPKQADEWNDLSWGHLVDIDGTTDSIHHLDPNKSIRANVVSSPVNWGDSSADMAYILAQSPVLYARHARQMLPDSLD